MKLVIFGSTGDLVRRKVIPQLKKIKNLDILATGRKDLTRKEYLDSIGESEDLKIEYKKVDLDNIPEEIFDKKNLVYIALPPELIIRIITQLTLFKNIDFRILIEKPFGSNLNEAIKLKEIIESNKLQVFLSDHYLFKKNTINLGKRDFHKLKIVSIEELQLGERVFYYVGALKDMIQSHFLNLVFKITNNPEVEFKDFKIIEFEKGQYDNYSKELGKEAEIETYVKLKIKTKDRLFEFVSGKAFDRKASYIEIDNEKIDLLEDGDSYKQIFERFINNDNKGFPKIDDAILAWKIVEEVEKDRVKLRKYPNNRKYVE